MWADIATSLTFVPHFRERRFLHQHIQYQGAFRVWELVHKLKNMLANSNYQAYFSVPNNWGT